MVSVGVAEVSAEAGCGMTVGNLLNEHQVLFKCGGVSRRTLHVWRTKKGFPKPLHVAGGSRNFWIETEVEAWLAENLVRAA